MKKILPVVMLLSFGFFYAHGTMTVMPHESSEHHDHHDRDYWQIVRVVGIEKNNLLEKNFIPYQLISIVDCCKERDNTEIILSSNEFEKTKKYKDSPPYLINKIFLI